MGSYQRLMKNSYTLKQTHGQRLDICVGQRLRLGCFKTDVSKEEIKERVVKIMAMEQDIYIRQL